MKKLLTTTLGMAVIVCFFAVPSYGLEPIVEPTAPPNAKPTTVAHFQQNNTAKYGIEYKDEDLYVPVATVEAGQLAKGTEPITTDVGDYVIDLKSERLIIMINPNLISFKPRVATHYSVDGGRWQPVSFSQDPLNKKYYMDFSKVLSKGGVVKLITIYDPETKGPAKYVPFVAKTPEVEQIDGKDGSSIYTFHKIGPRNALAKFSVDYYTCRDDSGARNGGWIPDKGADLMDIALTLDGKIVDEAGWGYIKTPAEGQTWQPNGGIYVQDIENGKQVKSVFLVRAKATYNKDSNIYAAASKVKRLSVAGVARAPTLSIDYKKEVVKGKTNMMVLQGSTYEKNKVVYDQFTLFQNDRFSSKGDGSEYTKALILDAAKAKEIKIVSTEYSFNENGKFINEDSLYGKILGVRMAVDANRKTRPASAIQKISIAPRDQLYQKDFAPTIAYGRMSVARNFEVYDKTKLRWGSPPRALGAQELKIRSKNAARYNAKTDTTTGEPASLPIVINTAYGSYDERRLDKKGVIGYTVSSYPWYDGLATFMLKPDSNESDNTDDSQQARVVITPQEWENQDNLVIKYILQMPDYVISAAGTTTQIPANYNQLGLTVDVMGAGTAYATSTTLNPASDANLVIKEQAKGKIEVTVTLTKSEDFKTGVNTITLRPDSTDPDTKAYYSWFKFVIPTVTISCEQPTYAPTLAENTKVVYTTKGLAKALNDSQVEGIDTPANYAELLGLSGTASITSLPTITAKQADETVEISGQIALDQVDKDAGYTFETKDLQNGLITFKDTKGNSYIYNLVIDPITKASFASANITAASSTSANTSIGKIEITLTGGAFNVLTDANAKDWFTTELPDNVLAKVSASDGAKKATITLYSAESIETTAKKSYSIKIPVSALKIQGSNVLPSGLAVTPTTAEGLTIEITEATN